MKILFLTNAYPDFDSSYHGSFVKGMASRLQKNGFRVTVVTPKIYKGSRHVEEQEGIRIYRFPFFAGGKLLIEYEKIPYLKMIIYYISGFLTTTYTLMKHHCHLIHAHWAIPTGLIGILASALFKRPLVVTIHGSDLRMAMDGPSLLRKVFLFVSKKAQYITCVSETQKREMEKLGISREKMSVMPMSIDEDFLGILKSREKDLERGPLTVFSNRNLLPIYNVSLLIRSIPMVLKEEPSTRFLIAGDGTERDVLEKAAQELDVSSSTQFLGQVPHEEMPNLLSQADIYVSTSLYDGTSVSLLEAMASGAFPVVTDIPSNREWILDGENGFLVPTESETVLAKRIIEAIRSHRVLMEARKKNREIVEERAHWRKNIGKITEIYQGAVRLA